MIKCRLNWKIWLFAPVAVAMAAFGVVAPAQAQLIPPSRVMAGPTTTTQSLQSLVGHPPAGGKRWIVNDSVAYGQAVKSGNWVHTPSGLSYTGCVYHVPNLATVRNGLITLSSGATKQLKPCEYPTLAYPGLAKPAAVATTPAAGVGVTTPAGGPCGFGSGGTWWAASCYGSQPTWVTSMVQDQSVPNDPAKDGALIFLWGGLEDANGDTLLQDVLTWGANGNIVTNPNIWYVTNWYLWGNNSVISASIHVQPGNTIQAALTASNCNGSGDCTWLMKSTDTSTGQVTSYTVGSEVNFTLVIGSDMEVPAGEGCVETPPDGHEAFRNLVMTGNTGTITPDFGTSTPDPQCSVSIKQTPTAADILWKP
jgi:hypothetical protein